MNIQHHTYRPTTVSSLFTAHNSPAENYSFASKERDTETGLSVTSLRSVSSLPLGHFRTSSNGTRWLRRFGARYYSSDLSIWLSVDPMVDKYPSFSPYVYCANNPVKLVDPNGEDYEVVVDEKNKTIIIKVTYYTNQKSNDRINKGVQAWNQQSGLYEYTTDEGQTYSVNFDLKVEYRNSPNEIKESRGSWNWITTKNLADDRRGESDGVNIFIDNDQVKAPTRTVIHEIGHTLGIADDPNHCGVMVSGGNSDAILDEYIMTSLKAAGINSTNESSNNSLSFCPVNSKANCVKQYNMNGLLKKKNP